MTEESRHNFEQTLLTGYLDSALTQGDEQRVRLHLEDCTTCRVLLDEMLEIREATMTTQFHTPTDEQWDEQPLDRMLEEARSLGADAVVELSISTSMVMSAAAEGAVKAMRGEDLGLRSL